MTINVPSELTDETQHYLLSSNSVLFWNWNKDNVW